MNPCILDWESQLRIIVGNTPCHKGWNMDPPLYAQGKSAQHGSHSFWQMRSTQSEANLVSQQNCGYSALVCAWSFVDWILAERFYSDWDVYRDTFRALRRAICKKQLWFHYEEVHFLHDSANTHWKHSVNAPLTIFGWKVFDHPTYSLDLAPVTFFSTLSWKRSWLGNG